MKIISCKEAKAKGLNKYFTGIPCKQGHKSERYTNNYNCIDCIKLSYVKYETPKLMKAKRKVKIGKAINAWRLGNSKPFWEKKLRLIKSDCKLRKIKFNLDIKYMEDLTIKQTFMCYYSGAPLAPGSSKKMHWKKSFTRLSVDRINPKLGYTKGNIALVSDFINTMKGSLDHREFISFMCLILSNHKILNPKVHQNNNNPIFKYLLKSHIKNAYFTKKLMRKKVRFLV